MIYAINKRTKEHRRCGCISDLADNWVAVEADPDGWIEWQGGECPLPQGVLCAVKYRDGDKTPSTTAGSMLAHDWSHTRHDRDIIAYRPILSEKPSEPEPPEWPRPGDKAELHNEPGYSVAYGNSAIGEEVEVLAVFHSGVIRMAAVEHDGSCYCFRAEMLRPTLTPEQRAAEAAVSSLADIIQRAGGIIDSPEDTAIDVYEAIRDGKVPGVKLAGGDA